MNKKIVIDPGHGGNDLGNSGNDLVEKDFDLLVSNYIKGRLDDLGIENLITRNVDRELSIDERISIMQSAYGVDNDVLVVSNHLNKGGGSGLEVIYALRNDDDFSEEIEQQVEKTGGIVNKYYQLRSSSDTSKDYYPLLRDTPDYETVMILYGYVDNSTDSSRIKNDYLKYAEAIVRAIALYTGNKYIPLPGDEYYVVKSGDSLWKIATSYGISVNDLKSANNLSTNLLSIGQLLFIPGLKKETGTVYVVKSGDSLWKIATNYGISVDALKSSNNLSTNLLSIGQELVIPSVSSKNVYIVKAGDSLWKIANIYGVSVDALKSANNLSTNLLSIGQELVIPNNS